MSSWIKMNTLYIYICCYVNCSKKKEYKYICVHCASIQNSKSKCFYLQLQQTVATNFTLFIFYYYSTSTFIYIFLKNYYETWTAVTVCIYLLLSLGLINLIKTTPKHPGDMSVYQLDRPDLLITVYYIFIIIVANPETHGNHW